METFSASVLLCHVTHSFRSTGCWVYSIPIWRQQQFECDSKLNTFWNLTLASKVDVQQYMAIVQILSFIITPGTGVLLHRQPDHHLTDIVLRTGIKERHCTKQHGESGEHISWISPKSGHITLHFSDDNVSHTLFFGYKWHWQLCAVAYLNSLSLLQCQMSLSVRQVQNSLV